MKKTLISSDWYFKKGAEAYTKVDLPHDYQISAKRDASLPEGWHNGYYPTEKGCYVKYFEFDQESHRILDLDGAYMNTRIILNEETIASHPYGFTPFLVDLTPYTKRGVNKLKITTNPFPISARWYTGNGIFRDVYLWEGGCVRIEPRDLFVCAEPIDDHAEVRLEIKVKADLALDALIELSITDPKGQMSVSDSIKLRVEEGDNILSKVLSVSSPLLWDTENPNLYKLDVKIIANGELTDTTETTFGIRKIEVDVNKGLLLNQKPIKLKGGCIHHDHGVLGAAAYPAAEERKVRLLKECGFNAIRTAHNPPSLAFLEACDRLGVLVMDEAFDTWCAPKVQNDYHMFFEDWAMRDISYMVRRDRNHPSVISYSIGNEIYEIDGTNGIEKWPKLLSDEIRKLDPTRFVTSGLQKDFLRREKGGEDIDPEGYKSYLQERFIKTEVSEVNAITLPYESALDIVGNNYYYDRYEKDHENAPDRIIWGSETMAIFFYDSWKKTAKYPYILGDFTWVAFDNMGEVGCGRFLWERDGVVKGLGPAPYPWRCCYQGDHELTGKRRPQSYFREMMWRDNTEPRIFVTHPEHFGEGFSGTKWHWYDVRECWSYPEEYLGKPIKAETYTRADEIEWLVNGKCVGRSRPEKGIAYIETVYSPGEITAIAYRDCNEVSRYTLKSFGAPKKIELIPERENFSRDGRDLLYIRVKVTDSSGITVDSYNSELSCYAEGARILGFFSGDPKNEDQYGSHVCHAFGGEAVIVISSKEKEPIKVSVKAEGISEGALLIP